MVTLESDLFGDVVADVLRSHWGPATSASSADLLELWEFGARQGWFELGVAGALSATMSALRELGRVACPLPVMDGFVTTRIYADHARVVQSVESGEIRAVVAFATDKSTRTIDFLDAAPSATHVVIVCPDAGSSALCPIVEREDLPGLAVPNWSRVLVGEPHVSVGLTARQSDEFRVLLRLGLAMRALAAAECTHEMAIEHAKTRYQFGHPIGSFGAVQQRTASCQIEIRAGMLLLADAARSWESDKPDALVRASVATEHARRAAPFVQFGAQHTLAAAGYFEEHPAPWLFRRVHADVVRMQMFEWPGGELADILIDGQMSLPDVGVDEAGENVRRDVRDLLRSYPVESPEGDTRAPVLNESLLSAVVERGWLGFGWPREFGGRSASLAEVVALNEEAAYQRAPLGTALSAVMLIGHSIILHGTAAQQERFLPLIRRGELAFCLGYSEPDVGSDLASLRTRAVRAGDGWIVNGEKSWTTGGHVADWMWLAARTDPDAKPRQAGITVFLIPMSTDGVTVQTHRALSGDVSCSVYLDDVRISDEARVGEINDGWKVIIDALAGERISMASTVASALNRQLDELLTFVRADVDGRIAPRGSSRRATLGALAVRVQAARALVASAIEAAGNGDGHPLEAPMAAVLGGELAEEFGESVLQILGPSAALREVPGAPNANFEYGLRLSVKYVVGGGTNDVQRGLIARTLGLPR